MPSKIENDDFGSTEVKVREMYPGQIKIDKARIIATAAHAACGHRRKHSGIAYINHPADVVRILETEATGVTTRMIMAAWMHDVVEDTKITTDFINEHFDVAVARMVHGLTNERPEGFNRAQRHDHNVVRLSKTARDVKTIKLADCIANMRDIIREDPNFAPTYLAEKRDLLDRALVGGCPVLWDIADNIITNYQGEKNGTDSN
jgi:(p)ppGpp synthase/HD superfamily hydrolase